jgi:hypothetical protein
MITNYSHPTHLATSDITTLIMRASPLMHARCSGVCMAALGCSSTLSDDGDEECRYKSSDDAAAAAAAAADDDSTSFNVDASPSHAA